MFAVIYQFHVKNNKQSQFVKAWEDLTQLIYKYEGSLGSRLHTKNTNTYIAYAQWPNKETWQNSGNNLPKEADEVKARMKDACVKTEVLHTLDSISDLLQNKPYQHPS